jgi:hypothetical protein
VSKVSRQNKRAGVDTRQPVGDPTVTKQEIKSLDRARAGGRGSLMRMMAIVHRSGSTRTQREIEQSIDDAGAMGEFLRVNGALVHSSEI